MPEQVEVFQRGDEVTCRNYGTGIIVETNFYSFGKPYSKVKFSMGTYAIYNFELKFKSRRPKSEVILEKINQLYERQSWVKEGKQLASFYIKPPVPSVEKKDMIDPVTISLSTLTIMNSALDADILQVVNRARTRFHAEIAQ